MEIDDQKKKSVNNYRQLATIILEWSSIINNYQQFARDYLRGQQLPTIVLRWSTISHNYQQFARGDWGNNYQQLATIIWGWSTIQRSRSCPLGLRIIDNYQQLFFGVVNNYRQLATIILVVVINYQQLSTISHNLQNMY